MYETSCQSRFDARYWMLGAGALGRPRGMVWGGRMEEGSGWGTHVYLWQIHFDVWQNQYNIVKFKNKIKLKKNKNVYITLASNYLLNSHNPLTHWGFPGGASDKEPVCQGRRYKRCRFDPWVGKIPWRSAWQPTPIFFSGESHGQRSLVAYSPCGHKESDTTEAT